MTTLRRSQPRSITPPQSLQPGTVLADRYFSEVDILPPSQVMGIFGSKGSGKSLLAAWLAAKRHRESGCTKRDEKHGPQDKCGGQPVYYFPAEYDHFYGEPIALQELVLGSEKMRGAILIWDEAQALLNKFRSASKSNRYLVTDLQQVRKLGCYLYYTSNAPKQLDKGIAEQTDIHGYVNLYTDSRCKKVRTRDGKRRHLRDCRDFMRMNWIDTQGNRGYDPRYGDGRKRLRQKLFNLVKYYPLYNTKARVSQSEIDSMDSKAIDEAREAVDADMTFEELLRNMKEWIAIAVKDGAKTLVPRSFAETIKRENGTELSPERIGRACKELGLVSKRTDKGMRYTLPAIGELHLWLQGLA